MGLKQSIQELADSIRSGECNEEQIIERLNQVIRDHNRIVHELSGECTPKAELHALEKKLFDYTSAFHIAQELTRSLDVGRLHQSLLYSLAGSLGLESCAAFSRNRVSGDYYLVNVLGTDWEADSRIISAMDPMLPLLEKARDSVVEASEVHVVAAAESREIMSQLDCRLIFPVFHDNVLSLILFLGPRLGGETFDEHHKEFLSHMGSFASIALENATLYSDLEQNATQLQQQKETMSKLSRYLAPELMDHIRREGVVDEAGKEDDVIVMFADIRKFTSMAEHRSPQETVSLLNTYFGRMVNIIVSNGGTLDKFIGDALLVYWGHPVKHKNDTLLAVLTAVAMIDEVCSMRERGVLPKDFAIGIGLHRGKAVLGNIGSTERMEYTVIGDTVNVASRLCKIAPPDKIIVSGTVYKDIFYDIETKPFGKRILVGRSEEQLTYSVESLNKDFFDVYRNAF